MSRGPENDTPQSKASPGYFIVRTTGEVVPLIAVDELPPGIDIVGVPRSLDLEGTIGMLNLGLQRSSGSFYQIYKSRDKGTSINGNALGSKASGLATQCTSQRTQESRQPSPSQDIRGSPTTTNIPPSSPRSSQQQPAVPRLEPQVCRHWCTYGICKWGQQCRFRHIMPMTLSGLRAVGLPDWPAWYRALNPGYFAGQGEKRWARAGACNGGRRCTATASNELLIQKSAKGLRGAVQTNASARLAERKRLDTNEEIGGQQTLARLKSMQLDGNGQVSLREDDSVSKNILLERASVKDTKDWEDDRGSDVELEVVGKKGGVVKEKLVDV